MQRIVYIRRYNHLHFRRRRNRRLTRRRRWRIIARRRIRGVLVLQRIEIERIRDVAAEQKFRWRHNHLLAQTFLGQKELRTPAAIVHGVGSRRRSCSAARNDAAVAAQRAGVLIALRILAGGADASIAASDEAARMIRIVASAQHVMMMTSVVVRKR